MKYDNMISDVIIKITKKELEDQIGFWLTPRQFKGLRFKMSFIQYVQKCGDKKHDSIYGIADKFGITVSEAKKLIKDIAKKGIDMPYNIDGFQR